MYDILCDDSCEMLSHILPQKKQQQTNEKYNKKKTTTKQTNQKKNKIEMSSAVTMICALRVNCKCPKISYTKVSFSADPDQAAPSEAI